MSLHPPSEELWKREKKNLKHECSNISIPVLQGNHYTNNQRRAKWEEHTWIGEIAESTVKGKMDANNQYLWAWSIWTGEGVMEKEVKRPKK